LTVIPLQGPVLLSPHAAINRQLSKAITIVNQILQWLLQCLLPELVTYLTVFPFLAILDVSLKVQSSIYYTSSKEQKKAINAALGK